MIQIEEHRLLSLIETEKKLKELTEMIIELAISTAIKELRSGYNRDKIELKAIDIVNNRWKLPVKLWRSISGGIRFQIPSSKNVGTVYSPIFKPTKPYYAVQQK